MNDMPRKPIEKAAESGEWIGLAWAAWCAGERNLAALGKQFNKAPATVKANLIKYSAARAAETQSVDATAEYIDGLEHDMREALRTYRTAENPNAKVGALKHATSCREKLAAAKGVVTERRSVAVGQDPGLGPLQTKSEVEIILSDPEAIDLACALSERIANSAANANRDGKPAD